MTPPMPPGLVRTHRNARPSILERWKQTEPVRLYVYGLLAAVLLALVVVGWMTEDLSAALTGILAALLVGVPGAEAARVSVISPATRTEQRLDESARWAAMVTARDAA
jgi:hypothetical protein